MRKSHEYAIIVLHPVFFLYLIVYAFTLSSVEISPDFPFPKAISYPVSAVIICSILASCVWRVSLGWLAVAAFSASKIYLSIFSNRKNAENFGEVLLCFSLAIAEGLFVRLENEFKSIEKKPKSRERDPWAERLTPAIFPSG